VVRRYIVHCPTTGINFNNAANTGSVFQNFANAAFIIASQLKNSTQFTLFLVVVLCCEKMENLNFFKETPSLEKIP
jgi:hypothetical protein